LRPSLTRRFIAGDASNYIPLLHEAADGLAERLVIFVVSGAGELIERHGGLSPVTCGAQV